MSKNIVVECKSGIISKKAAHGIASVIYEYFQNPEHLKAFEEWKKVNSTSN